MHFLLGCEAPWVGREYSFLVLYNEKDNYPNKCVAYVFEKIVTVSLIL